MRKAYILAIALGLASFMFGADVVEKKSKMKRLGNLKMKDVATVDGFEYFSGHLDTSEKSQRLRDDLLIQKYWGYTEAEDCRA